MDNNKRALFELLSFSLGKGVGPIIFSGVDWQELIEISFKYDVPALVLDGLHLVRQHQEGITIPKAELLNWMGQVLYNENQYLSQFETAKHLADIFWKNSLKTIILKGYSVSLCYPIPSHRTSCDLDCFVIKKNDNNEYENAQEESDRLIESKGVAVDRSYYKNSSFVFEKLSVENHRYCCSIKRGKRTKELEAYLENLLKKGDEGFIDDSRLILPPLLFQAIFMMEHACAHFLYEKMSLKNICDWAMFRKHHQDQLDWTSFDNSCERFGLKAFSETMGHLADFVLGNREYDSLDGLDKRVLADTLKDVEMPQGLFRQRIKKAVDMMKSGWKFRHYNNDSMIKELSRSVWAYTFEKNPQL